MANGEQQTKPKTKKPRVVKPKGAATGGKGKKGAKKEESDDEGDVAGPAPIEEEDDAI